MQGRAACSGPRHRFPGRLGSEARPGRRGYVVFQLGDWDVGSTFNRIHMPDSPCPGTPQKIRKLPLGRRGEPDDVFGTLRESLGDVSGIRRQGWPDLRRCSAWDPCRR